MLFMRESVAAAIDECGERVFLFAPMTETAGTVSFISDELCGLAEDAGIVAPLGMRFTSFHALRDAHSVPTTQPPRGPPRDLCPDGVDRFQFGHIFLRGCRT